MKLRFNQIKFLILGWTIPLTLYLGHLQYGGEQPFDHAKDVLEFTTGVVLLWETISKKDGDKQDK